jgi:methyl-accepting chemotaxis protein
MKFDIIAVLLKKYEKSSLQVRTKSRILCWTSLVMGALSIVLGGIMLLTGAIAAGLIIMFFSVFCFAAVFALWTGRYYLASSIFLYVLFAVMFLAIFGDDYKNVYECYVFAALGGFLLIAGALIASKSRQTTALAILVLAAIAVTYYFHSFLNPDVENHKMSLLAIQSLVTSSILILLGGLFASMLVKSQNKLLISVEKEAEAATARCSNLDQAMREAQGSAVAIGGRLASSADTAGEAVKAMRKTVDGILSGMDVLSKALGESESANAKAVGNEEKVNQTLTSYSQEVAHASGAIEEMAAAVSSIGGQASAKKQAVQALVGMAQSGEAKLSAIKGAIDRILESAQSMMEMSVFIEDVAERTNLLGLNASIEAAHAGQTGKGFAVVADQIRALSVETSKSSRLISETLKETRSAIAAASAQNGEALDFFRKISDEIREVGIVLDEFLSNIQEISAGVKDVLDAVEAVSSLTASTEDTVKDSRLSITHSSRGIQDVSQIAGRVKEDSTRMAQMISAVLKETDQVQRLGDENLKMMEGLKAKIDEATAQ